MGSFLDNLFPLRGRLNHTQYAGWEPTRFADRGMGCRLDSDVRIPVAGGVELSADVYRPKKSGRYPAIVQVGSYNKELHSAGAPTGTNEVGSPPVITDRGYVQVLASRRGMGRSAGESGEFLDEQEIADNLRAIAWAAEQPWCNGEVCLFGTSYYGLVQPLVAVQQPPQLRAMFANEICTDHFRHLALSGGIVQNRFFALWLGANFKDADHQRTVEPWRRALASQVVNREWLWETVVHPRLPRIYQGFMTKRPTRDMRAWFAHLVAETKTRADLRMSEGAFRSLDRIVTPFVVVHNGGMWNVHQQGAFDLFERAASPTKYLIISKREYELPVLSWQLEALAFFDHVVKGCDNGYAAQPAVRYHVDGAEEFQGAASFPPPDARRTRLYLGADGALVGAPPDRGSASYTAVPLSAPLPDGMDEVMEQKLAFSAGFDGPTTLAGPLTLTLSFSCNEIDTFVVAALSRLDASGHRHLLSLGSIRPARRRVDAALSTRFEIVTEDGLDPLVPGSRAELRFSLTPTAARFAEGERLLLEIASRSDLVKGDIAEGYVHLDVEAPPYFSRNTIHFGAGSHLDVELVHR